MYFSGTSRLKKITHPLTTQNIQQHLIIFIYYDFVPFSDENYRPVHFLQHHHSFFVVRGIMRERLNSDGQQFYQYNKNNNYLHVFP